MNTENSAQFRKNTARKSQRKLRGPREKMAVSKGQVSSFQHRTKIILHCRSQV